MSTARTAEQGDEFDEYIRLVVEDVRRALRRCGDSQFNGATGINEAGFQAMFAVAMAVREIPFGGAVSFERVINAGNIADAVITFDPALDMPPCVIEFKYVRLGFLRAPPDLRAFNNVPGGISHINDRAVIRGRLGLLAQAINQEKDEDEGEGTADAESLKDWLVVLPSRDEKFTSVKIDALRTSALDQARRYARLMTADVQRKLRVYAIVGVADRVMKPAMATVVVRPVKGD